VISWLRTVLTAFGRRSIVAMNCLMFMNGRFEWATGA
jgi:hypothetical protein